MSSEVVTPNEMARRLGVTGLQLRNWLRAKAAAGDLRVAGHRKHERWEFDSELAEDLMSDFRREVLASGVRKPSSLASQTGSPRSRPRKSSGPSGRSRKFARSPDPGHRSVEEWMGKKIETLEDLLRRGLLAVCVGINPAPRSVAAGHYYQGSYGQRFFGRLRQVGLLPESFEGYEDDAAFAAGVGFTDLIKRPTRVITMSPPTSASTDGRCLSESSPPPVPAWSSLRSSLQQGRSLGPSMGNGFVSEVKLAGCEVFVMPGPNESNATAQPTLQLLASRVARLRQEMPDVQAFDACVSVGMA